VQQDGWDALTLTQKKIFVLWGGRAERGKKSSSRSQSHDSLCGKHQSHIPGQPLGKFESGRKEESAEKSFGHLGGSEKSVMPGGAGGALSLPDVLKDLMLESPGEKGGEKLQTNN